MVRQHAELRERYTGLDEGARLAAAFATLADNGSALTLITRYETALRRSFHAAVRLLENAKLPNEPNSAPDTALPRGPQFGIPRQSVITSTPVVSTR